MPKLITFRCTGNEARRIDAALILRDSGLFPEVPKADPTAATPTKTDILVAILDEWRAGLPRLGGPERPSSMMNRAADAQLRAWTQSVRDDERDAKADAEMPPGVLVQTADGGLIRIVDKPENTGAPGLLPTLDDALFKAPEPPVIPAEPIPEDELEYDPKRMGPDGKIIPRRKRKPE